MCRTIPALDLPAITAGNFPSSIHDVFLYNSNSAPIVISAYFGKSSERRSSVSAIQAWRLARRQYTLLEQVRGRLNTGELRSLLDEFVEAFGPVAVLVGGGRRNPALVARISSRYPNLVRRVQADSAAQNGQLRALAAVIVNKRIAIPADAPWRDRCVRRFCAISEGKLNAQILAAMQFVARADEFVAHVDEFTAPQAAPEKPGIAAAMIGFRAVTIEAKPGEPGLCASGRDAIIRRLTGPVFHIDVKVI
ncbi:MAG: hypothetical protein WBD95_16170 [Xanthobacteraceae bacterium]